MSSPSVQFICDRHPTTLELDGSFLPEEGPEVLTKLILTLEKRFRVRGWLLLKEEAHTENGICGHVITGHWSDNGMLTLEVAFSDVAELCLTDTQEPVNFLVKCKLTGPLPGSTVEAGMDSPVFQGECSSIMVNPGAKLDALLPGISSDSKVSFRYSYAHATSRCSYACIHRQKLQLQRLPAPDRFVRPGIVEIRHSRRIGRMQNHLGLGVHDICEGDVRDAQSLFANWVYVMWASAFWELRPAGYPNEFYIMTYKQIATEMADVRGCLTVRPCIETDPGYEDERHHASVFYFGEGHECTWKLTPSGTKFVAEVHRHQDEDAQQFIGHYMCHVDFDLDNRDNLSYYVFLSDDRNEAVELEFIYHDPEEFGA